MLEQKLQARTYFISSIKEILNDQGRRNYHTHIQKYKEISGTGNDLIERLLSVSAPASTASDEGPNGP